MLLNKFEKNKPTQFSYTCHNCSNTFFVNSTANELKHRNRKETFQFIKERHRKPMHCYCGEKFKFKNK